MIIMESKKNIMANKESDRKLNKYYGKYEYYGRDRIGNGGKFQIHLESF